MPWWHTLAAGGATWAWLRAALAKTDRIGLGTGLLLQFCVTTSAVVAQVFATLGRCSLAGSFSGL